MKLLNYIAGLSVAIVALTGCLGGGQQQSWGGQGYGNQQPYGYGNQQPYGYGNQQPYGYGNQQQQPYGYGNQGGGSVLGNVAQMVLMNILMGQLGINQLQAMGGAGALFQVAQQRMQPADFNRLSAAVPGMDQYLAAAPRINGNAGYQQSGALGGLMSVANSFQQLGMGPEMVGRFVPVMLNYVQQQGGAGTMSSLQNALQ